MYELQNKRSKVTANKRSGQKNDTRLSNKDVSSNDESVSYYFCLSNELHFLLNSNILRL